MKPQPLLSPDTDIRAYLLSLHPAKRRRAIAMLGEEHLDALDRSWPFWRHRGQGAPVGDWRTWIIKAGRGFGKTRAGAEWIRDHLKAGPPLKIALVGATLHDAREVMVEGDSGLLAVCDHLIDDWLPSRGLLKFDNGSEARLFSGASPQILRGPQHHYAWCDELAKWEKPQETWDMLQFGMRLGARPQVLVTTTPAPGPVLAGIMAAKGSVVTGGSTNANPHLPKAYVEAVEEMYGGTRLGRQEIDGELLPDVAGALWSVELLERCRLESPSRLREGLGVGSGAPRSPDRPPPTPPASGRGGFTRTVIGVDPPSGDGTCGIIACALDADGIGHVLADHSVTARSPEGWARAVAAAAEVHGAQMVVAETNQGGAMVEAVLRAADSKLRVRGVKAEVGKADRAVPVASRFEASKVRLHGRFPELEAELCGLIAGGGYEPVWSGGPRGPGRSPDRADAMVWALSELMLGKSVSEPRVRAL